MYRSEESLNKHFAKFIVERLKGVFSFLWETNFRATKHHQGDTQVRTPKSPPGFFGYTHLKNHPKKPTLLL